ncbi:class I fructose-bisphosphate aldolase [Cohnella sp. REN36]|uniref:class I fructose-bisphosphate aldolase n=1 Tax=Cohnella sp. REN36 TaxID=2887347 RepID=UPI001D13D0F4|nr:aldolase [Cohnella sp. REN36]MCC3374196.1 aldolase [Cohnella sp. REN36]
MQQARLNRLFGEDGHCLDVAIDHGVFNETAFLQGIEDLPKAVASIVSCRPDAIQLTPGAARHLQSIAGPNKPALVIRTDVANFYGSTLPSHLFDQLIHEPVIQAVRLDAACVVGNLVCNPGQPELYHQTVRNIAILRRECEQYGMPLMVEPLVMKTNSAKGGYGVDGDLHKILPLVRQAAELGADVIKADPCDDPEEFHLIVECASGVPVLPRGGGTADDKEVLRRTYQLMRQGARGLVYGRNIIQHPNPIGMTKALMAIVHEGATPEQAMTHIG